MIKIVKSNNRQDIAQQNMQEMKIRKIGKKDQSQASQEQVMVGLYISQKGLHTKEGIDSMHNSLNVEM